MADESDNQTNNQSNNQLNDQSNQQNNNNSSSKEVILACDTNNGNDQTCQDTVARVLEGGGYKVTKLPIGPNEYATYSYSGNASGKIGVYLMAASLISFLDAASASFDYNVLGIRGDVTSWGTEEGFKTKGVPKDHHGDCTIPECDKYQGKTYPELNEIYKDKCQAVPGEDCEKLGQNILAALGGQSISSGAVTNSGGGAQIKDKTFEQCIRRICAATDSVFLVENNAAVLFPYVDWLAFTLREKIQTIKPIEIDPDVFMMEYQTQGTYNKVTIAWGGTSLPERFPDNELMHKKYVEAQKNKTETTTKRQNTTRKMSTDSDGTNLLSEQYDSLVEKYGELEKRVETPVEDLETAQFLANALLIQYVRDFNNVCQCRSLANRKYIGGTFYVVTNPFTYEQEMFYLNGYTIRTQKKEPIYFDLDFRYGPESAEDLLDLQTLSPGGSTSSGDSGVMGGEAADINEIAKIACKGISDPLGKAKAIHEYLKKYIVYSYYECSKSEWGKDPSKIWQAIKSGQGTNCADTANLTRAVMSAAGLNATVVHGPNHFWTVVTINGKEYASDLTADSGNHSRRSLGEVWDNLSYDSKCGNTASC